jgi:hypothetical protein
MNFSWLTEMISDAVSYFFGVVFLTATGAGVIGLIAGIIAVIVMGRKGVFNRPYAAWTSFAKLNYIYTPVCFTVLFGLMGAIYGVQTQMDDWVDSSAWPITVVGEHVLPMVEFMSRGLNTYGDLDDAIYTYVDEMFEGYGYLDRSFGFFFSHYIHMLLNEFGYPETVAGVQQMADAHSFTNPSTVTLQRLPSAVKSYYGVFFRKVYIDALWAVFPYFLIPAAEYVFFWFVSRSRGKEEDILVFEGVASEYV